MESNMINVGDRVTTIGGDTYVSRDDFIRAALSNDVFAGNNVSVNWQEIIDGKYFVRVNDDLSVSQHASKINGMHRLHSILKDDEGMIFVLENGARGRHARVVKEPGVIQPNFGEETMNLLKMHSDVATTDVMVGMMLANGDILVEEVKDILTDYTFIMLADEDSSDRVVSIIIYPYE